MATILVIDDDPHILRLVQRCLEEQGHLVFIASTGREGLKHLEEGIHDLIVTDILMPDADGLEVLMEIRNRHSAIPVIAMSGAMQRAPMDFLPVAEKFGARKVFYKPIVLDDLAEAVRELLDA